MKTYPHWMPPESIGQRIARLRGERHLSLRELAAQCGVSAATLSRVERDSDMQLSNLIDIAKGLGVEVVQLIEGANFDAIKRD